MKYSIFFSFLLYQFKVCLAKLCSLKAQTASCLFQVGVKPKAGDGILACNPLDHPDSQRKNPSKIGEVEF